MGAKGGGGEMKINGVHIDRNTTMTKSSPADDNRHITHRADSSAISTTMKQNDGLTNYNDDGGADCWCICPGVFSLWRARYNNNDRTIYQ